jgi:small subunit ribosomal protein S20
MANTSSAKKAQRVAQRRRIFNLRRKTEMKGAVKEMKKFLAAKNSRDAVSALPGLYQAIDKAAKNQTIHKNTAARMKSRAAKALAALSK